MRFSILQLGHTPAKLSDLFERYPPQFQNLLRPQFPDAVFEEVPIVDGAPVPNPKSLDAIIVTGSAFGVYDTPAWIDPMRDFLRQTYQLATPTLGICFGHQLIADALGGNVQKSEKGWGMGRHVYDVDQSALGNIAAPKTLAIAASHQDQVLEPPTSAKRFLSSNFTPYAGLVYDNDAIITMQPHPEFDVNFSKALCRLRLDNPHSADVVAANEKTLDVAVENERTAKLIADYLRRAL